MKIPDWIHNLPATPLVRLGFKASLKNLVMCYLIVHEEVVKQWPSNIPAVDMKVISSCLVAIFDSETNMKLLREADRSPGKHMSPESFASWLKKTYVGSGDKRRSLWDIYNKGASLSTISKEADYYKYRGSFACQLTFRANYEETFESARPYILSDPAVKPQSKIIMKKPFRMITCDDIDSLNLDAKVSVIMSVAYTLQHRRLSKVTKSSDKGDMMISVLRNEGYNMVKKPKHIPNLDTMKTRSAIIYALGNKLSTLNII